MARGHWWCCGLSSLIGVLLICGAIVYAVLSESSVQLIWPPYTPSSVPSTPSVSPMRPTIRRSTIREVWSDWQKYPTRSPLFPAAIVPVVVTVAAALIMAWICLPALLTDRRVIASFGRSLRAVFAGVGLLAAFTWIFGQAFVWIDLRDREQRASDLAFSFDRSLQMLFVLCVPIAIWILCAWVRRSVLGARGIERDPILPIMCESCGYDLTHRPENDVCPECGTRVDSFFGDVPTRGGGPWERARLNWFGSSMRVLFRCRDFYSGMAMRSGLASAEAFARLHYIIIGVSAWLWMLILMIQSRPFGPSGNERELLVLPVLVGLMAPLCGMVVACSVGALAATAWAITGYLADARWARKIIAYETAFLWAFCAYNGMAVTFAVIDPFRVMQGLEFATRTTVGIPLEMIVFVFGNAGLACFWLLRYRIAGKAVRWANA